MAANAVPVAHMENGINGTKSPAQAAHPYTHSQTPVPLPTYAAPQGQAPNASPAQSSPLISSQQHHSPPVQPGTLYQGHSQPPAMQNGNVAPIPLRGHLSPSAQGNPQQTESAGTYQTLVALIDRAPASVVRHVIRDKWEKSLMGSQYHIAFLLNATMHQASPETVGNAVKEFGADFVQKAKHELVGHLSSTDIDELADSLISRASPDFLDRVLARRLETISARQLVNALARAERLGYNVRDIVREHDEQVIPSMHSVLTSSTIPPGNDTMRVKHYQPRPIPSQQLQQPQPQPPVPQPFARAPPLKASSLDDVPMGPPEIVSCNCGWPCASEEALNYHKKKNACYKVLPTDQAGRDICVFCGCRFGSNGGILYHEKSEVCGPRTADTCQKMMDLIEHFRTHGRSAHYRAAHSLMTPRGRTKAPSTEHHATLATPTSSQPSSTPQRDPYAHLTPDKYREFNAIMKTAEEKYGGLMREAALLDEPERSKRLAGLKNSYNTKQSTTRKKFGIRLRERRTREEIEAEENRLFNSRGDAGTPTNGTPVPDHEFRPNKRPRTDDMEASASGVNGNLEPPQKRVFRAEMGGGLSGSQATAELTDPTAHLNPPQPRYTPQKPSATKPAWSSKRIGVHVGTQEDPMSIDEDDSDTDSDSDSDSDGDIPATLN
ncbi:hypothetical protein SNK05_001151 [Fusarium graminearum]|uniref:Chromosome 1, complete genome n=2 Tax=Gibberella zeae (strain ATCC MYA-4620 / CBS 123657 / FGSC 9075 / NRRL 31084 / PH-1) TaxID=229533 RepID=A0A1C3YI42_GIBZE|nr:unnamed protein product [Fusarium graminearum]